MAGNSHGSYAENESKGGDISMDTMSEDDIKKVVDELLRISSLDQEVAYSLVDLGFTSLDALSDASVDKLIGIDGVDDDRAKAIIQEAKDLGKVKDAKGKDTVSTSDDNDLAKWLTGESEVDLRGLLDSEVVERRPRKAPETGIPDESEIESEDHDALKSWLSGDSESFSEWLGEESFEDEKEIYREEIAEKEVMLESSKKDIDRKLRLLDTLKTELQDRLKKVGSGDLDISQIVDENLELQESLGVMEQSIESMEEEKETLQKELDEIKLGAVAMLRFIKSKKMELISNSGADPTITVGVDSEEFKELKEENERLSAKIEVMGSSDQYKGLDNADILEELKAKEIQLERYEREVKEKTHRIQEFQNELNFKKEELEKLKENMRFKEDELNKHETDLQHREELMRKEMRDIELLKQEFGDTTEKERNRRLEELEKEISRKEHELKAKESYIEQKQRELRAREEDMIDEELEERKEEILHEIAQEKAKTGTSRLDDLLLGGFPLGSNISIYGPPHVGKRVLISSFIAEGLEKGVPAIWVITDKTISEVREEMKFVLPTYEEYEIRGLVYYVDAYSISMGEVDVHEQGKDYITFIDEQSDIAAINEAVEKFSTKIMNTHRYYRLAFESVSTLIAYLDTTTTFRSLQPFAGRRKKDKAVALYTLEKGMHSEQDISMLGHMMDGEVEFKFQQLQTYLRVEGLGDVQTRQWVKYQHSKSGITMGSFSLDTIR